MDKIQEFVKNKHQDIHLLQKQIRDHFNIDSFFEKGYSIQTDSANTSIT